jgi:hypothetical protein
VRVLYSNSTKRHVKLLLSGDEILTGDLADAEATAWHASREIGTARIRTSDGQVHKAAGVEWLELAAGSSLAGLSKCAGGACDVITAGDVMIGLNVSDPELFREIVAGSVRVELTSQGVTLSARAAPSNQRKAVSRQGTRARVGAETGDGNLIATALRNGGSPWR